MNTNSHAPDQEHNPDNRSRLFTVRVWKEAINPIEAEWRGWLQHVPSGQVFYFRNWDTLVNHIVSMLPGGGGATLQLAGVLSLRRKGRGANRSQAKAKEGRTGSL